MNQDRTDLRSGYLPKDCFEGIVARERFRLILEHRPEGHIELE